MPFEDQHVTRVCSFGKEISAEESFTEKTSTEWFSLDQSMLVLPRMFGCWTKSVWKTDRSRSNSPWNRGSNIFMARYCCPISPSRTRACRPWPNWPRKVISLFTRRGSYRHRSVSLVEWSNKGARQYLPAVHCDSDLRRYLNSMRQYHKEDLPRRTATSFSSPKSRNSHCHHGWVWTWARSTTRSFEIWNVCRTLKRQFLSAVTYFCW